MLKNTQNSFGSVSRIFHWLMSIMIICLLCVGFYMSGLENSPGKFEIYGLHKSTGVVVLLLVLLRIVWRLMNITPNLLDTMPSWQVLGYKIGITAMYILMLGMPISGVLMSRFGGHDISVFGLFAIPAAEKNEAISYLAWNMHGIGAWAFVVFVTLHAGVAIYHHFINKDRLLMRMVKGD
jgi:cytochrome b561